LFIYPRRGNHSLSLTNRTARHDAAFQHVRMLKWFYWRQRPSLQDQDSTVNVIKHYSPFHVLIVVQLRHFIRIIVLAEFESCSAGNSCKQIAL
jgi:hypothetical protein